MSQTRSEPLLGHAISVETVVYALDQFGADGRVKMPWLHNHRGRQFSVDTRPAIVLEEGVHGFDWMPAAWFDTAGGEHLQVLVRRIGWSTYRVGRKTKTGEAWETTDAVRVQFDGRDAVVPTRCGRMVDNEPQVAR